MYRARARGRHDERQRGGRLRGCPHARSPEDRESGRKSLGRIGGPLFSLPSAPLPPFPFLGGCAERAEKESEEGKVVRNGGPALSLLGPLLPCLFDLVFTFLEIFGLFFGGLIWLCLRVLGSL